MNKKKKNQGLEKNVVFFGKKEEKKEEEKSIEDFIDLSDDNYYELPTTYGNNYTITTTTSTGTIEPEIGMSSSPVEAEGEVLTVKELQEAIDRLRNTNSPPLYLQPDYNTNHHYGFNVNIEGV